MLCYQRVIRFCSRLETFGKVHCLGFPLAISTSRIPWNSDCPGIRLHQPPVRVQRSRETPNLLCAGHLLPVLLSAHRPGHPWFPVKKVRMDPRGDHFPHIYQGIRTHTGGQFTNCCLSAFPSIFCLPIGSQNSSIHITPLFYTSHAYL